MNAREAKRYVLWMMAAETEHHLGNGSDWLFNDHTNKAKPFSAADTERICKAVKDLSDELARRSGR